MGRVACAAQLQGRDWSDPSTWPGALGFPWAASVNQVAACSATGAVTLQRLHCLARASGRSAGKWGWQPSLGDVWVWGLSFWKWGRTVIHFLVNEILLKSSVIKIFQEIQEFTVIKLCDWPRSPHLQSHTFDLKLFGWKLAFVQMFAQRDVTPWPKYVYGLHPTEVIFVKTVYGETSKQHIFRRVRRLITQLARACALFLCFCGLPYVSPILSRYNSIVAESMMTVCCWSVLIGNLDICVIHENSQRGTQ